MSRPTQLHINTQALLHNLKRVRELVPESQVLAMVKANAYGHGLTTVAQHLPADAFGVACLEEALTLRDSGIKAPIVLMEGFFTAAELEVINQHQLDIVIHSLRQIDILERTPVAKPLNVWFKIDTGMHRLGILPHEVATAWQRLKQSSAIADLKVMTHFAAADDLSKPTTEKQIQEFLLLTKDINVAKSMAQSAAILEWPASHSEWVRPGVMLYGVSPFAHKTAQDYDLRPVMHLTSELIAIRPCKKGDAIGYGGTWTCPDAMNIGVVAIGYGDGYPRHAISGTPVLLNGRSAPLVGRVSMDMITIDLRQHSDARVGDEVVLWGDGLPLEIIAQYSSTIPYELMCAVTQRVRRVTR